MVNLIFFQCVPHTFYSSIDIQLFVVGLFMVYLLCKKPKLGVLGCLALIIVGNATLYYQVSQKLISPVLIERNVTVAKTINYLDLVHFATYGHLSNYFIGLLVAYSLKIEGFLTKYSTLLWWAYFPAVVVSGTIHFAPALHNTFRILTPETTPLYIVGAKFLYVFYTTIFIYRYFQSMERKTSGTSIPKKVSSLQSLIKTAMSLTNDIQGVGVNFFEELGRSQVMSIIIRLTFAMYICNYAFIRFDYFSSRLHIDMVPLNFYSLSKRLIFTLSIVCFLSFFFHVLFVAPFDNLRRSLNIRTVRKENKDK